MGNARSYFERLCMAMVTLVLAVGFLVSVGIAHFMGYEAQWVEPEGLPAGDVVDSPSEAVLSEAGIESASRLFPSLVRGCSLSEGIEPQGLVSPVLEAIDAVSRSGESFVCACIAGMSR
ncbi:hypothetical protein PGW94_01540 [Candidatus Anaplasma sp. TIGMIC]|nr:hypothetical protein [Candidatus Anaplasma sp. TIGMIC]